MALHPSTFGLPAEQAIISELNKKYANKVLHDVGLCICIFDISQCGEGKVRYGDGCLWYKGASDLLHVTETVVHLALLFHQSSFALSYSDHLPVKSF